MENIGYFDIIAAIIQAGVILGKIFGFIDWNWFQLCCPTLFYCVIVFIAALIATVFKHSLKDQIKCEKQKDI